MQSALQLTAATARDMAVAAARGESLVPFLVGLADVLDTDAGVGLTTWARSGGSTMLHVAIAGGPMPAPVMVATVGEATSPHPALSSLSLEHAVRVRELPSVRDVWCTEGQGRLPAYVNGRHPIAVLLHRTSTSAVLLSGHRARRDFTDADVRLFELVQRPVVAALAFRAALEATTKVLHTGPRTDPALPAPVSEVHVEYQPTRRESEVLALAASGWTNVRIARRLGISERTVRKHLSSVYDHSGLQGRAAAAAWWVRHRAASQAFGLLQG